MHMPFCASFPSEPVCSDAADHVWGVKEACFAACSAVLQGSDGYLEFARPGGVSHCKEECETIAKVRGHG